MKGQDAKANPFIVMGFMYLVIGFTMTMIGIASESWRIWAYFGIPLLIVGVIFSLGRNPKAVPFIIIGITLTIVGIVFESMGTLFYVGVPFLIVGVTFNLLNKRNPG